MHSLARRYLPVTEICFQEIKGHLVTKFQVHKLPAPLCLSHVKSHICDIAQTGHPQSNPWPPI